MSAVATPPAPAAPPTDAGPRPWKWTREDYYKLGELGFFDGKRVELIRGEIVEMSPINEPHAAGVGLVDDALRPVFAVGYHTRVQQPFWVPGGQFGTDPQPDVAVVPGGRRGRTAPPTAATVIVEVADATLFYDTTTKAQLYAEAGVTDYWVLDLANRQLLVFRDPAPVPGGASYRTGTAHGPADAVAPLAAPNATARVADLLP
ncbi:MAG: Uma2 family endonuclease [Isosphaera sp.]|nr:Uma2 family endonuclease [Isosphaera sp.]